MSKAVIPNANLVKLGHQATLAHAREMRSSASAAVVGVMPSGPFAKTYTLQFQQPKKQKVIFLARKQYFVGSKALSLILSAATCMNALKCMCAILKLLIIVSF